MALVIDPGPLLAALDADDEQHDPCLALVARSRQRRILPAPILPEVDYWCQKRLGVDAFLDLLADIDRGASIVEDLPSEDYRAVERRRSRARSAKRTGWCSTRA